MIVKILPSINNYWITAFSLSPPCFPQNPISLFLYLLIKKLSYAFTKEAIRMRAKIVKQLMFTGKITRQTSDNFKSWHLCVPWKKKKNRNHIFPLPLQLNCHHVTFQWSKTLTYIIPKFNKKKYTVRLVNDFWHPWTCLSVSE